MIAVVTMAAVRLTSSTPAMISRSYVSSIAQRMICTLRRNVVSAMVMLVSLPSGRMSMLRPDLPDGLSASQTS